MMKKMEKKSIKRRKKSKKNRMRRDDTEKKWKEFKNKAWQNNKISLTIFRNKKILKQYKSFKLISKNHLNKVFLSFKDSN